MVVQIEFPLYFSATQVYIETEQLEGFEQVQSLVEDIVVLSTLNYRPVFEDMSLGKLLVLDLFAH